MKRRAPGGGDKPDFLEQQRQFEQVGNRTRHRDDAGANGARAITPANLGGGAEDRQFAGRLLAIGDEGRNERPRRIEFARQQRDARRLVEHEIIDARIGGGDKLGDRALMNGGMLPEVERRQMEAEDVDGAAQRAQATARQDRVAMPCASSDWDMVARSAANSSTLLSASGSASVSWLAQRPYCGRACARGLGDAASRGQLIARR